MPPKKTAKPNTRLSRGRSKSVEKRPSNTRSRTPSRSRSRSRASVTTHTKRSRTPASESKLKRRRSPSPFSESSSSASRSLVQTKHEPSVEKQPLIITREPSRVSQRIIEKMESMKSHVAPRENTIRDNPVPSELAKKSYWFEKIGGFFSKNVCSSPIVILVCLLALPVAVLWCNLLVFAPASGGEAKIPGKPVSTIWGPGYRFGGVFWPTDLRVYLDMRCHLFVAAYLLLHVLLARFAPLGYRVSYTSESGRTDYRCNGLVSLIFFSTLFITAQWCDVPYLKDARPSNLLMKYWISLISASLNISVLLAVVNYFATRHVPRALVHSGGNTGSFIVDLSMGRSTRPRWFGVDWKMILLRPSVFGLPLIQLTLLCAQWERYGRVNHAIVAQCVMQFILALDFSVFEGSYLTSFGARYEGLGYFAIVTMLNMIFLYSLGASYLSLRPDVGRLTNADSTLNSTNCLLLSIGVLLFLTGYWIYRASNNQKALFARQPNHPSFSDMDKIFGPHSYRMLVGGWWGIIRHPNYLGDLMMAYAMALPAGFVSSFTWFYPVFLTFFLLCRTLTVEQHSYDKHGLIMVMYKKMVPDRLVPKIF